MFFVSIWLLPERAMCGADSGPADVFFRIMWYSKNAYGGKINVVAVF